MGDIVSFTSFKAGQLLEDGRFHISMGNLDQAIDTLQEALELEEQPETLSHLAWVLYLKGQYQEAKELCGRAIALDPDFGNPYNDLGSCYLKEQRWEEAIFWLEKAKKAKKYESRHFAYINLGHIYSTLGRLDDAIKEFNGALEIVPGHPEVLKVLEQLKELKNNS